MFENRFDAGRKLVQELIQYKDQHPVIVALARGGVPVGFEIARELHAPLEVLIVRKLSLATNPEFGIGAITEGNVQVLDKEIIHHLKIPDQELLEIIEKEKQELYRRIQLYRNNKPLPKLTNQLIILVDDGLATGVSAEAAIVYLKKQKPKHIIFTAPVCAKNTSKEFMDMGMNVICLVYPANFGSVAQEYKEFDQLTDEEVIHLLQKSRNNFTTNPLN